MIDAHHVLSVQLYTIYSVSVLYIVFSVFVRAVVGVVVLTYLLTYLLIWTISVSGNGLGPGARVRPHMSRGYPPGGCCPGRLGGVK